MAYAYMKGTSECDDAEVFGGVRMRHHCHGGRLVMGIYHFMKGYSGWNVLPEEGDSFDMVCGGFDLTALWTFGGPMLDCGPGWSTDGQKKVVPRLTPGSATDN